MQCKLMHVEYNMRCESLKSGCLARSHFYAIQIVGSNGHGGEGVFAAALSTGCERCM